MDRCGAFVVGLFSTARTPRLICRLHERYATQNYIVQCPLLRPPICMIYLIAMLILLKTRARANCLQEIAMRVCTMPGRPAIPVRDQEAIDDGPVVERT